MMQVDLVPHRLDCRDRQAIRALDLHASILARRLTSSGRIILVRLARTNAASPIRRAAGRGIAARIAIGGTVHLERRAYLWARWPLAAVRGGWDCGARRIDHVADPMDQAAVG